MELWNVGDASEALCPTCDDLVPTTFRIRSVTVDGVGQPIDDVLVAACDRCGATVAIPAQSTPRLKEALERSPAKLAARVNRKLDDALRLVAAELGVRDCDFRSLLIRWYLARIVREPALAHRVRALAHGDLPRGPKTGRVEVRLPEPLLDAAWAWARAAGLRTRTELLEGVIALAAEDVLRHRAPARCRELREVAALA
jgi:hypothetical protein